MGKDPLALRLELLSEQPRQAPKWKELFEEAFGPERVAEVKAATPVTFAKHVEVRVRPTVEV